MLRFFRDNFFLNQESNNQPWFDVRTYKEPSIENILNKQIKSNFSDLDCLIEKYTFLEELNGSEITSID